MSRELSTTGSAPTFLSAINWIASKTVASGVIDQTAEPFRAKIIPRKPAIAIVKVSRIQEKIQNRKIGVGMFSINVVSFSRNVVLRDPLFSLNSVSKTANVVGSSR